MCFCANTLSAKRISAQSNTENLLAYQISSFLADAPVRSRRDRQRSTQFGDFTCQATEFEIFEGTDEQPERHDLLQRIPPGTFCSILIMFYFLFAMGMYPALPPAVDT